MFQRLLVVILVLCIAPFGLSGCASKETFTPTVYRDCYDPIKKLRDDERRVASKTAATAAFVAAGYLAICLASGGKPVPCLLGATIAAAAAGAVAYHNAVKQQTKDENARMARYMMDLDGDISNLNIATASARMAIQCYEGKFQTALSRYKKKEISREQLDASYAEITGGIEEAQKILGKVIVSAEKNDKQYRAAIEEERKVKPIRNENRKPASGPPSLGGVEAKQASYQAGIQDAQKADQELVAFRERMRIHMESS